ncbi:MAG: T9SS type A sorting domain-containing protein [Candidatus Cloacimonetes bacterium]|nr:T9SS type A sorting domain-containing protein [Candidatus Cloacimonadota bacterium]
MKILFFTVLIIMFNCFLSAIIINIPDDQQTIQEGIDVAVDGDTVLVQPGIYHENINYNGKNITVASLFITTQDSVYINQTIIDGSYSGSVVTFESGEDSTAILRGFTIINGEATQGGGIHCANSSPKIDNILVTENYSGHGAGIYLNDFNGTLSNCQIISNSCFCGWGGGIYIDESNITLQNSIIQDNTSSLDCDPYESGYGGGIYCRYSYIELENVNISNNYSNYMGGGICLINSMANIYRSIMNNNESTNGGAIWFSSNESNSLNIVNTMIFQNFASYNGSAIKNLSDSPISIMNSTICENLSDYGGAIVIGNNASLYLINDICWNNYPYAISHYTDDPVYIYITYSNILGGQNGIDVMYNTELYWLDGNINQNPYFIAPNEWNYQLSDSSLCIGAGIDSCEINDILFNSPNLDIIGNPRPNPVGSMPDMGAYENPFGEPQLGINIYDSSNIKFHLNNYPNPFNPSTTISFSILEKDKEKPVTLNIYNIKGQKVKTLVNNKFDAGEHSVVWDGRDFKGKPVSSGIYFYKLKIDGKNIDTKRCLLLK